jgi:hypothetical protein
VRHAKTDGRESRRLLCGLLLLLILLSTGAVRWRLLDVPLERDEGEYAYGAQLLLDGAPLYDELYSKKLPGVFGAYALFVTLFGQSARGIHIGLLLVNAATIVLLYLASRRLLGASAGLAAAATFALLSPGRAVQGLFANAEHLVLPFVLGGFLLALAADRSDRTLPRLLAGLCLGLACLMKQHGALLALPVLLLPLLDRSRAWSCRLARTGWLAAGTALPLVATVVLLRIAGTLESFRFWTVTYTRTYATRVSPAEAWSHLAERGGALLAMAPLVWLLAAVGLIGLFHAPSLRESRRFLALLFVSSVLAVVPGFYFRPHYFLLLLPAASLLTAAGAITLADLARTTTARWHGALAPALLLIALGQTVAEQSDYLFRLDPQGVSRATYGRNPFPESREIAAFVERHSSPTDRIAVLGSEPQILFYARRRSATGFVYTYDLMENQPRALAMQEQMAHEIETSRPSLLVAVNLRTSWAPTPDSERWIFDWLDRYRTPFHRIAAMTIDDERNAKLWTDPELSRLPPDSRPAIEIYARR